jgi:hypothetical protein
MRLIGDYDLVIPIFVLGLRVGMRLSWRLVFRILLTLVVLALAWRWIGSRLTGGGSADKTVTDLGVSSPLNQPGGGVAPADAYAVYDGLYQAPMDEPLAFAESSGTDIPQVDGSCLKPATAEEREMADAFAAANGLSHQWREKFLIPQGYKLLAGGELKQAQSCLATHGRDAAVCEKYKDIKYVRYLGVPGFDSSHDRALVSVIKSCGGLCGSGGIFVVEKVGGGWKRLATSDFTRDCSWAY